MSPLAAAGFGALGGLTITLLRIGEYFHLPLIERPATFTDPFFYLHHGGFIIVSGLAVGIVALTLPCLSEWMAFIFGIVAPITIGSGFSFYRSVKGWGPSDIADLEE